jgi:hypothetical protein
MYSDKDGGKTSNKFTIEISLKKIEIFYFKKTHNINNNEHK